jgi:hypothetical protein
MKSYRMSYRKEEWVTVEVSFAENIYINDMDHISIAEKVAVEGDLVHFEMSVGSDIPKSSIEFEEIEDGAPDVVIGNDGSVMSINQYLSIKDAFF